MATSKRASVAETMSDRQQAAELGAVLRKMRTAHGRSHADVAESLRIRQVYIQAMEDGRFDDLPGPTYAAGFMRAYADYLGLDVDEVVNRFKATVGDMNTQASLVPPSPMAEGRMPTGPVMLFAAVLAVTAYGGWYYLSSNGADTSDTIAGLPGRIAQLVGTEREPKKPAPLAAPSQPAEPASETASEPVSEPIAETTAEPTAVLAPQVAVTKPTPEPAPKPTPEPAPAAIPEVVAAAPEPAPALDVPALTETPEVAATTPEPAPAPEPQPAAPEPVVATAEPARTAAVTKPEPAATPEPISASSPAPAVKPAAASRVMLRANASVWIEVREGGDKRILSRVMRAGETFPVPARPGLTMTTGNAGSLEIVVDGKRIPPLGPVGGVRRDVALDAGALLSDGR